MTFFIFLCQTNLLNCVKHGVYLFYQDRKPLQNEWDCFEVEFGFFQGRKIPTKGKLGAREDKPYQKTRKQHLLSIFNQNLLELLIVQLSIQYVH